MDDCYRTHQHVTYRIDGQSDERAVPKEVSAIDWKPLEPDETIARFVAPQLARHIPFLEQHTHARLNFVGVSRLGLLGMGNFVTHLIAKKNRHHWPMVRLWGTWFPSQEKSGSGLIYDYGYFVQ